VYTRRIPLIPPGTMIAVCLCLPCALSNCGYVFKTGTEV
jgi:hypothetical protein